MLAEKHLQKLDANGAVLLKLSLKNLGVEAEHTTLSLNSYDQSLWLVSGKTLLHLNGQGQLLTTTALPGTARAASLGLDEHLWVLGNKTLWRYSPQAVLLASYDLKLLIKEEPKHLAVDSLGGKLWLAAEKQLIQLDLNAPAQRLANLSPPEKVDALTLDPRSGTLWLLVEDTLLAYGRDGSLQQSLALKPLGIKDAEALVFDPLSQSLWIGHKGGLTRLSSSGASLATLASKEEIEAIGVAPFMLTPSLTLIRPPHDALTNAPQPAITFGLDALCLGSPCGFSPAYTASYSLNALLNNGQIGTLFIFDATTGQTTYTPSARLPEGVNTLSAQAKDAFGHYSGYINSFFTIDSIAPVITLTAPAANLLTNQPQQALVGTISEPAALLVNAVVASVGAAPDYRFEHTLTRLEGANTLELRAVDAAGNTGLLTRTITLDTIAPAMPDSSKIKLSTPSGGLVTVTAQNASVESNAQITITNSRSSQVVTALADATGAFSAQITAQGGDTLTLTATDKAGNRSAALALIVAADSSEPPPSTPGPTLVASVVDPTVVSILANTTAFLYSGANPVQTGVASGTIVAKRAAVLRGKVTTRDNLPLPGTKITVLNHPEFGQTLTRDDGVFDMAVNGGGVLTIRYEKSGYLPLQRQVHTPWQDFVIAPDVVMIPLDTRVTTVAANAAVIQVAQGNVVTDADGSRKATLLFAPNTSASMTLPNGTTQALASMNVRATEYTVGANGPKAMPASLPPTSGYTYAVELSVDEAIAIGAKTVTFSQPVAVYVENFLNFPVGGIVPAGYYDRDKAAWIPAPNGRVIKILAIVNGLADVDADGDGLADNATQLAALNISDAERQQLAGLYQPGANLWRVPVSHFTPWDYNWPFGPPAGATKPNQPLPKVNKKQDDPCLKSGSIIECQNQTLGERIAVTGTPFDLNYRSDRVPGRKTENAINIPLSSASVPASLKRIELEISVAGRQFLQTFTAAPNQSTTFEWDGKDVYGRALQGGQAVSIRIGYVYGGVYKQPNETTSAFGYNGNGMPIAGSVSRQEITLWQESRESIESLVARSQGLGGWSANIHHAYDPNGQVLYLGDGTRRSAQSINVITTVAGNGVGSFGSDGGLATAASVDHPWGVTIDAQGNLFIADSWNYRIRKVSTDGIITTVAGNGAVGYSGDGGLATAARLNYPRGVTVDAQGSLFIADTYNNRIRKVSPDGIITTVAGNGSHGFSGDGGLATAASLSYPWDVTVDAQGNLFIADIGNNRIRKVSPDGIITTVAGNGVQGFSGDGDLATAASLNFPYNVTVDAQGRLFIADSYNNRITTVRLNERANR